MTLPVPRIGRPQQRRAVVIALASLALLGGCGAIRPLLVPSPQPTYYSLASSADVAPRPASNNTDATAPTLIVSPPQAAAGFDSQRMIYLRKADQPEYFAVNEWVDTPARMLAPLIVSAVERGGAFRAVVLTPSPAAGELRLDTEILRLQQEFTATTSSVRFSLRAVLVESSARRVIATQEFEAVEPAASADPRGGAAAANRAVQAVLEKLAAFCAAAGGEARKSARMRPPTTP